MKKILLSVFTALIVLASCNTNDAPVPAIQKTQTEQNTQSETDPQARRYEQDCIRQAVFLAGFGSKEWQADKYIINGEDLTSLFGECSLDNIQTFYRDGRYIETEGATKCAPTDPDIFDQGTFTFTNNCTQFDLVAGHLVENFDIILLSPLAFRIKYTDPTLGEVQLWLVPAHTRHTVCKGDGHYLLNSKLSADEIVKRIKTRNR